MGSSDSTAPDVQGMEDDSEGTEGGDPVAAGRALAAALADGSYCVRLGSDGDEDEDIDGSDDAGEEAPQPTFASAAPEGEPAMGVVADPIAPPAVDTGVPGLVVPPGVTELFPSPFYLSRRIYVGRKDKRHVEVVEPLRNYANGYLRGNALALSGVLREDLGLHVGHNTGALVELEWNNIKHGRLETNGRRLHAGLVISKYALGTHAEDSRFVKDGQRLQVVLSKQRVAALEREAKKPEKVASAIEKAAEADKDRIRDALAIVKESYRQAGVNSDDGGSDKEAEEEGVRVPQDAEDWRGHDSAEAARQRTSTRNAAAGVLGGAEEAPAGEVYCRQPGCPKKTMHGVVPQYCKQQMCKECCRAAQLADPTKKCKRYHKPDPTAASIAAAPAQPQPQPPQATH